MKRFFILICFSFIFLTLPFLANAGGYCGDGDKNVASGEECDDGNFDNRDGCSSYCTLEDMEAPTVVSTSISVGAIDVPTTNTSIRIIFSEEMDPDSFKYSWVQIRHNGEPMPASTALSKDGKTATVQLERDLYPEDEHAIWISKLVKDIHTNTMEETYIQVFTAGEYIDHTAPNVISVPEGGEFHQTQTIRLKAFIGDYTASDEFLDPDATIYYTTDGSTPNRDSKEYKDSITTKTNLTIRFYAIDDKGNTSDKKQDTYLFNCSERANATKIAPYPICTIQECEMGFVLQNNICVKLIGGIDEDSIEYNSATVPTFSSDSPFTITSKPAIYLTPQHKGIFPRPVIFKDNTRGTTIHFEKGTKVTDSSRKAFSGYLKNLENLYNKDYPTYFGYSFKSIFKFEPEDGRLLTFNPSYTITIPYTDRFDSTKKAYVITYDDEKGIYELYPERNYDLDLTKNEITITSRKTGIFFIAQIGESFNRAVFTDIKDHWAQYYIETLYREGIVKGRAKDVYAPDAPLTRAEFVKIALMAIGEEIDLNESVDDAPFRDVPMYAWYAPFISRAKDLGLIHGYRTGFFKPDQSINRAEAIKILISAFKFNIADYISEREDDFEDIFTDQWYFPYVNFTVRNELVDGKRNINGKVLPAFGPARPITRAEMAKLAIKTMEFAETYEVEDDVE